MVRLVGDLMNCFGVVATRRGRMWRWLQASYITVGAGKLRVGSILSGVESSGED
jgi:hypothetical protein